MNIRVCCTFYLIFRKGNTQKLTEAFIKHMFVGTSREHSFPYVGDIF